MAEELRSVEQIMAELFEGLRIIKKNGTKKEEAALKKYAKVRWVQFEIDYYRNGVFPLREVMAQAKVYFSKRFLDGQFIDQVSQAEFNKAYDSLNHAVKDGCHGRCFRLVEEFNAALDREGVKTVERIENFLDWLTFYPVKRKDYEGNPIMEKPYNVPIIDFKNDEHLEGFYKVWRGYYKKGILLSMQEAREIYSILAKAKKLPKERKSVQTEGG